MRFLTDEEIRALPDDLLIGSREWCAACGSTRGTERAHIRSIQMGGRKKQGPRIFLCRDCHGGKLHHSPKRYGLEVDTEGNVYWREGAEMRVIGRIPEGVGR